MRAFFLAALTVMLALPALAQDAKPAVSPFTPDVRVRAVYYSSLIRENDGYSFSMGIKLREGQYYLFADGRRSCEEPAAPALGRKIESVWDRMMRRPGVENDNLLIQGGGLLYLETLIAAPHMRAGTPVNTDLNPANNLTPLRDLAFALQEACLNKDATSFEVLRAKVDALAANLK